MSKIKDKVVIERLVSFNNDLNENNVISKKDVLSLEDFVGYSVITASLEIDKFTDYQSGISVDQTKNIMNGVLDEIKQTENLSTRTTYEDLSNEIVRAFTETTRIRKILNNLRNIDEEIIDRMLNQKYIYSYVNDDGEHVNNVWNIATDTPIHLVFNDRNDFLMAILGNDKNGIEKFNNIKKIVNEIRDSGDFIYSDLISPILLSVLKHKMLEKLLTGKNVVIEDFTLTNFVDFQKDLSNVIKDVDNTLIAINHDRKSLTDNHEWEIGESQKELNKLYNFYKNYNAVVGDKKSRAILNMMCCIAA